MKVKAFKNKNKKTSRQIHKSVQVLLSTWSLIMVQAPTFADNSLGTTLKNSMSGNSGSELTNAATSIFQGVTNLANQMGQSNMQGTADQIKAWQTLRTDAQKNIGKDSMGATRHFMFPNCLVPPDTTAKPGGLCSASSPQYMIDDFLKIGQDYINMYKKYVNTDGSASNTASPVGTQCIDNSLKNLEAEAQTAISELEKMMNQFDMLAKNFKNNNQANLKEMRDISNELYGSKTQTSLDNQTKDYSNQFGKECNDVLGGTLDTQMKSNGLINLSNSFISKDSKAANFRGDSLKSLKSDIEKDKQKLIKYLKENGITSKISTTNLKYSNLADKVLSNVITPVNEKINRANAIIQELGISDTLPKLDDPTFSAKLDTILEKAQTSYQDKFILDCMRGTNNVAYSDSIINVIGKFENRSTSNQGADIKNFKANTADSLASINSLADFENEVKSISTDDIKVKIITSSNEGDKKTLYQYYSDLKNECTAIYNGNMAAANGDTSASSYKKRADKAKSEIADIQKEVAKIVSSENSNSQSISAAFDDLILNCSGQNITSNSCDDNTFSTSDSKFCVKKAQVCSTYIGSCKEKVQAYATKQTNNLKARSDLYNKAVTDLETQANTLVGSMSTIAENLSKNLYAKLFPSGISAELRSAYSIPTGSGFEMPEGVKPINMTATANAAFGNLLLKGVDANGTLNINELTESMRSNVSLLKESLQSNIKEQISRAAEVAEGNNNKWVTELNSWKELVQGCQKTVAEIQKNINEQNQQAQEAAAENSQKQQQFCRKMVAFSTGPGCNGTYSLKDLYEEAVEISNVLGADVFDTLNEYQQVCDSQNEGDDEDKKTANSSRNFEEVERICDAGDSDSYLSSLKDDYLLSDIPSDFEKYEKEIKDYLDGKTVKDKDFQELVSNTVYGRKLRDYISLSKKAKQIKDSQEMDMCKYVSDYANIDAQENCKDATDKPACRMKYVKNAKLPGVLKSVASATANIVSAEKKNQFSQIGEKSGGTSCASVVGSSTSKGMFQNISQDFADIFSQGAMLR